MIVVAGEALVDLIVAADGSLSANPGGGPFNAARTMARLGAPVAFAGRLSDDRFGRQLRTLLVEDGVDLGWTARTSDPTTLAVAELDDSGAASYRFYLDGTSSAGLLSHDLRPLPGDLEALHLGTLGLMVEPMAATYEGLLADLDPSVLLLVDPNCRPSVLAEPDVEAAYRARLRRVLGRADVVKVSGDDLAFLSPDLPTLAAARLLLEGGPAVVLLTDGPAEIVVVTKGGEDRVPVPAVTVVDTVGAGDAFGGGFLASWTARGWHRAELAAPAKLRAAVSTAARVAAVTCGRQGADPPRLVDLDVETAAGFPAAERRFG